MVGQTFLFVAHTVEQTFLLVAQMVERIVLHVMQTVEQIVLFVTPAMTLFQELIDTIAVSCHLFFSGLSSFFTEDAFAHGAKCMIIKSNSLTRRKSQ